MNKLILSVAVFGFASSAFAAAGNNDIILGFWADGGVGASSNVEFVVGNTLQFKSPMPFTTLVNVNGLLSSTYGADWNTRTDLFFGYAGSVTNGTTGTGGEIGRTVYAASVAPTSLLDGVKTAEAYNRKSAISQGTPAANINDLRPLLQDSNAIVVSNTDFNTWGYLKGNTGFANFFRPDLFANSTAVGASGYVASDLFEMLPGSGAGTYLGTFALYANGDVVFGNVASAIPEPSTYAAIVGAAALGFAALRRRKAVLA